MDLNKFTQKSVQAIQDAQNTAIKLGNPEVTDVHLSYALLSDSDSIVAKTIQKLGSDYKQIVSAFNQKIDSLPKNDSQSSVYPSTAFQRILLKAEDEAKSMGDSFVSVEHIFMSILGEKNTVSAVLLKDYNVTISDDVTEKLSDEYDKGKILETDPKKGTTIKEGDVVKLTISKGKYIVIDDYIGMDEEKATKALEKLGLEVEIEEEVSSKSRGTVIDQSIDEGEKLDPTKKKELKITLTVSKGNYTIIGDYLGMDVEKAKEALAKLGFEVVVKEEESEKPVGTVIDQSLQSGHKVDPDETNRTITLTVSSGVKIEVPNVVGMDINAAKSRLESKGFVVVLNKLSTDSLTEDEIDQIVVNRVVRQSPDAFSTVTKNGETVTLDYYDKKPEIPEDE